MCDQQQQEELSRDCQVCARDWLDVEYQGLFEKPWLVIYPDNQINQYETEEEACAEQQKHRIANNLDPMTGEG